ncbi:MAG: hypothetical protein ACFFB5_02735 [Promethearchaeota archaeon]
MTDELDFFSNFYECSFQLVPISKGTDLLEDIFEQIEVQVKTINQLLHWKRKHLLFPKPTLSTDQIFVFWVHPSIVDKALRLTRVRGGFKICQIDRKRPDSSTYKGKKQNSRPRRILLDVGCDDPLFVQKLIHMGLEVELVWRHAANLMNYEIIEICTAQYIDLFVTRNEQILTPTEEWLTYLMPHRIRLFFPPSKLLKTPEVLAQAIYDRAHAKRKRKRPKPHQLQLVYFNNLEQKSSENIQSK